MLLIGTKKLTIYEIDKTFNPNVSDDKQISNICVS